MRHLHESLKQSHHLKHYGRLQYNLFLKGIRYSVKVISLNLIVLVIRASKKRHLVFIKIF
jgi:DNA primase large subunit